MKQLKWMVLIITVLVGAPALAMVKGTPATQVSRPEMAEPFMRQLASEAVLGNSTQTIQDLLDEMDAFAYRVYPVLEQRILKNSGDIDTDIIYQYVYYLNTYINMPSTSLATVKQALENSFKNDLAHKSMVLHAVQPIKLLEVLRQEEDIDELTKWQAIFADTPHQLIINNRIQELDTILLKEVQAQEDMINAHTSNNTGYWNELFRRLRTMNNIDELVLFCQNNFVGQDMPTDILEDLVSYLTKKSSDSRIQQLLQSLPGKPATQFPLTQEQEDKIQQIGKDIDGLINNASQDRPSSPAPRMELLADSSDEEWYNSELNEDTLQDLACDAGYADLNDMLQKRDGRDRLRGILGYNDEKIQQLIEKYVPENKRDKGKGKRKRSLSYVQPQDESLSIPNILPMPSPSISVSSPSIAQQTYKVTPSPSPNKKPKTASASSPSSPAMPGLHAKTDDLSGIEAMSMFGGMIMLVQDRPLFTLIGMCGVAYAGYWLYNKYWVGNKIKEEDKQLEVAQKDNKNSRTKRKRR